MTFEEAVARVQAMALRKESLAKAERFSAHARAAGQCLALDAEALRTLLALAPRNGEAKSDGTGDYMFVNGFWLAVVDPEGNRVKDFNPDLVRPATELAHSPLAQTADR